MRENVSYMVCNPGGDFRKHGIFTPHTEILIEESVKSYNFLKGAKY